MRHWGVYTSLALAAGLTSTGSWAQAQIPFRRGDANVDGGVDIADAGRFSREPAPSCWDAADVNGDGETHVGEGGFDFNDVVYLLSYLFLGGAPPAQPGPDSPGLAPPEFPSLGCASYAPSPPSRLAEVAFGIEGCPEKVSGSPGELKTFQIFATLATTGNSGSFGPEAWSFGLVAEGGSLTAVTKADSLGGMRVLAIERDSTPVNIDLKQAFFALVEPADDLETGQGGAVSGIALPDPFAYRALKREGTQRIARFTVEVQLPPPGETRTLTLRFADGLKSQGRPVRNVVSIAGTSQAPDLGRCTVRLESVPPRPHFHRADPNADGLGDITDAIFILDFLFTGGDASGCRESADVNNDGDLDISDPVALLGYLFLGGARPAEPGPPTSACGPDPDEAGSAGDRGCQSYVRC